MPCYELINLQSSFCFISKFWIISLNKVYAVQLSHPSKAPGTKCCVGQNIRLVFSIRWLWYRLVVFNFIRNNFVRLYCDSCHISVHLKKNLPEVVNFCVAILILKMGKKATFSAYYALLFQER